MLKSENASTNIRDFAIASAIAVLGLGFMFAASDLGIENAQRNSETILNQAFKEANVPYERGSQEYIYLKKVLLNRDGDCESLEIPWPNGIRLIDKEGKDAGPENRATLRQYCETVKSKTTADFHYTR